MRINYSSEYAIQDYMIEGTWGLRVWGGRPHMFGRDLDAQMDEVIALLERLNMKVAIYSRSNPYPSRLRSRRICAKAKRWRYTVGNR